METSPQINGVQPYALMTLVHESLPVVATLLWLVAYAALLQKLRRERTAQGLSMQSLLALLVAETLTLVTLAFILTQNLFAQAISLPLVVCQVINCFLVLATFSLVVRNFSASYEANDDDFGQFLWMRTLTSQADTKPLPRKRTFCLSSWHAFRHIFRLHWLCLYVLAAGVAITVELLRYHRTLPFWLSYLESFAGMLSSVALVPQVRMFYKAGRQRIAPSLGRFVTAMLLARIVSLTYWVTDGFIHGPHVMPGRGIRILTDGLNILILSDFTCNLLRKRVDATTALPL